MSFATKTEKGKRPSNEDNCLAVSFDLGVLIAVSDGMGGHAAGAVASELTIKSLLSAIKGQHSMSCENFLSQAYKSANKIVYDRSKEVEQYSGMGTTLVAAIARQDAFFAANVGDSRLYLYRSAAQSIIPITHDHSYVQELVSCGLITAEEAKVHPNRNLITRAIGTASSVDVDLFSQYLYDDDMLILCSDGLCGVVSDDQINDYVRKIRDLDELCDALIQLALANGSRDNITVAIYRHDGGERV